jgi:hypothetical protein
MDVSLDNPWIIKAFLWEYLMVYPSVLDDFFILFSLDRVLVRPNIREEKI